MSSELDSVVLSAEIETAPAAAAAAEPEPVLVALVVAAAAATAFAVVAERSAVYGSLRSLSFPYRI